MIYRLSSNRFTLGKEQNQRFLSQPLLTSRNIQKGPLLTEGLHAMDAKCPKRPQKPLTPETRATVKCIDPQMPHNPEEPLEETFAKVDDLLCALTTTLVNILLAREENQNSGNHQRRTQKNFLPLHWSHTRWIQHTLQQPQSKCKKKFMIQLQTVPKSTQDS